VGVKTLFKQLIMKEIKLKTGIIVKHKLKNGIIKISIKE